jgi:hypothetical protein
MSAAPAAAAAADDDDDELLRARGQALKGRWSKPPQAARKENGECCSFFSRLLSLASLSLSLSLPC